MIINRSHLGKSSCEFKKNVGGKFSPKNTISGFTIPPQFLHKGISSENIFSVIKKKKVTAKNKRKGYL